MPLFSVTSAYYPRPLPLLYHCFCPNSNTIIIISPVTDCCYRNVIWTSWFRDRVPKAGSCVPGETLSSIFLHVCLHGGHKNHLFLLLASQLISTFLPGETFSFVMTHVDHLWVLLDRCAFTWSEEKEQVGRMQYGSCWVQFIARVTRSAWPQ